VLQDGGGIQVGKVVEISLCVAAGIVREERGDEDGGGVGRRY